MKSEGEKPEGGASAEQEALNHPTGADTQEGLPSQASASSNAAPAKPKKEKQPGTTNHSTGRGGAASGGQGLGE